MAKPLSALRRSSRQRRLPFSIRTGETPAPTASPALAELTKRGVGEGRVHEPLAGADPEFVIDQLEWGDHQVRAAQGNIRNPAGFYIHLIEEKIAPPEDFLTRRRVKALELAREARNQELALRYEREEACHVSNNTAVDRHIAAHTRGEDMGHELRRPEADFLRDGIYELRVSLQQIHYRILCFFHGTIAAVVSHGLAKEQMVPSHEIDRAMTRKRRFAANPERHTHEEA